LDYATLLGGGGSDEGRAVAVDGTGHAYVAGVSGSFDFLTTAGAFDTSYNGGDDAFVVRLNPAGTALDYATFLGGRSDDWGFAIAVDGAGHAYLTGITFSADFPTAAGAFDTSLNSRGDAFVVRLNPTGTALDSATFLGGSSSEQGYAIAVDGAGNAYVAGVTSSADFPTTSGALDTGFNGGSDVFVLRLNAAGTALDYATFLGGGGSDEGRAIAVDGAGNAYVSGGSFSADFPATPGAFDIGYDGSDDAFVAKLAIGEKLLDLTTSTKQPNTLHVRPGQVVTYTITLANRGKSDATTARLTDTLPISLTYQAGSLWASSGSGRASGSVITWTGTITAGTGTTVRYAAVVSPALSVSATVALVNQAQIDDGVHPPLERSAAVFINPAQVWLPVLSRGMSFEAATHPLPGRRRGG
jgi:uncharacterized repeat protein (TIGR01451 family)